MPTSVWRASVPFAASVSLATAMVFGELYRNGAERKFRAIGQRDAAGLRGTDFGLVAGALLTNAEGKVANGGDFVFFNNLKGPDGSVEHTGDNLMGEGEGDDGADQGGPGGFPAASTRSSSRSRCSGPRAVSSLPARCAARSSVW